MVLADQLLQTGSAYEPVEAIRHRYQILIKHSGGDLPSSKLATSPYSNVIYIPDWGIAII